MNQHFLPKAATMAALAWLISACGGGGTTVPPGQTVVIQDAPPASVTIQGGRPISYSATAGSYRKRMQSMSWSITPVNTSGPALALMDGACANAIKTEQEGVGGASGAASSAASSLSSSVWTCPVATYAPVLDRDEVYRLTVSAVDVEGNAANHTTIITVRGTPAATMAALKPLVATAARVVVKSESDAALSCFGQPGRVADMAPAGPDALALRYRWSIKSNPSGLALGLTDADKSTVRVSTPAVPKGRPGTATLQCTVTDIGGNAASADVEFVVSAEGADTPEPSASAASSLSLFVGTDTLLSCYGTGGYVSDAEGAGLKYQWVIRSNPAGVVFDLSGADTASAKVRPVSMSATAGGFASAVFQCRVTDDALRTATVDVPVTVSGAATGIGGGAYVQADAGQSRVVAPSAVVVLDASGSKLVNGTSSSGSATPTASPLFYRWSQVSGPTVSLSNAGAAMASFVAPALSTRQTLRFMVQAATSPSFAALASGSETAYVDITVSGVAPPRISVPSVFTFASGAAASMSITVQNNPEGRPVYYRWTQVSGPSVKLQTPNQINVSFFAPVVSGAAAELVFRVEASFDATFAGAATADVYARVTP